jgi:RNA polymerase sigma factor (sigma-70 family)
LENIITIVKGCINAESRCQRAFYNLYRGFALKVVFRYIYRYERAIDVVTDGFVKAFTHFCDFRLPDEADVEKLVMAWLKKIMINCSIDDLRKNNMLPEIGSMNDELWEVSDKNDDADRLLLYADLMLLVKELPATYRAVFNMYVIDGYSHTEIAEHLNMPLGSCRSALSRAKALLQEKIKNLEEGKLCRI